MFHYSITDSYVKNVTQPQQGSPGIWMKFYNYQQYKDAKYNIDKTLKKSLPKLSFAWRQDAYISLSTFISEDWNSYMNFVTQNNYFVCQAGNT